MAAIGLARRGVTAVAVVGAACVVVAAGAVAVLAGRAPYGDWMPAVLVPLILLVSLPVLQRVAARCNDPALVWLLVGALVVKLFGAVVRYYLAFDVYGGNADAGVYHQWGVQLSTAFRAGTFETGLSSWTDTDFVRLLTGVLYTVMGPSLLGGFFVFAWMAFAGQVLFHLAFVRAVPDGRHRRYALLVYGLPTLLFWPSSIGKEAWMVLTLGLVCYGAARLFDDAPATGLVIAVAGLALAGVVRPHVAGLLTLALFAAMAVRRGRDTPLGPVVRVGGLLVVAVVAVAAVSASQDLLRAEDAASALETTADRTSGGDSSFAPVLVRGPQDLPVAAATVLFRPHLLEAHNLQARLSALEGATLALLALVALPGLVRILPQLRARPYVVLAIVYTLAFIVAYSSIANFGILVRQRAQLYPVFAVLLALPRVLPPVPREPRP